MKSSHPGCRECGQRDLDLHSKVQAEQIHCQLCTDKIVDSMEKYIDLILGVARQFYIGRSNYPERRLLEHFTATKKRKRDQ